MIQRELHRPAESSYLSNSLCKQSESKTSLFSPLGLPSICSFYAGLLVPFRNLIFKRDSLQQHGNVRTSGYPAQPWAVGMFMNYALSRTCVMLEGDRDLKHDLTV